MTRNIFDPQKCEPYLTTFGQQVLQVILQLCNDSTNGHDDRTNYGESIHHRKSTKNIARVLTFIDESINTCNVNANLSTPVQIYSTEHVLNSANNFLSQRSTTTERIETFHDLYDGKNNNNFLHPTVFNSNIVGEKLNKDLKNRRQVPALKKINTTDDNFVQKATNDNVNWDNMFDSELCNFENIATEDNIAKDLNYITPPSNITIHKENSNSFSEIFNQDPNQGEKRKIGTDRSKIVKKSKNFDTKPEDHLNSRKSNDDVPKQSFRKQNYTTTVKNWLNDMDLNNTDNDRPNLEEIGNTKLIKNTGTYMTEKQEEMGTKKGNNTKLKITIDKTIKCTKKVVQARLANKDGIMKFAKPIQDKEPEKIDENDNKSSKDKKEKVINKFIPPIKSQIPVKDITYEVFTLDEKNANECCIELSPNVITKVIAVLIYSNGFCQLNCHFTEEACAPDGILLRTGDKYYYLKGSGQNVRNMLVHILEKNTIICYDARNVLIYLASHLQMDISKSNMYDAKIGASLLDPDNPPENFSDVQKLLSFTAPYTIATECTLQKAAWYMSLLDECWTKLKDQLAHSQLWQVFVEIEMKLLPIISEMERRGVAIDESKLKSMEEALLARMKVVEQECYEVAKKVFQINSTVQVRSILYDELQLDTKHNIKIAETLSTGVKSTSETMLRSLMSVHPLPKLILEYRHLHKAHATFLAGIAHHVIDGTVKPTWVQTAAATGRIASNNPNLQAIPKVPFSLVMFPDVHHNDVASWQVKLRSVYVPRAGRSLLAADFQHVECRVFAHVAADASLLSALASPADLFQVLAARWLGQSEERVSGAERARTKRLVYASVYGAGARKLRDILDVSYERALQVAASFDRTFPSLKSFGHRVVSQCAADGGRLATLSGRLRHFAHIASEDFARRAHAQRQAVNFVVQGSAADLCKTAMILTEEHLRNSQPPVEAYLLLQIHDELVWEVKDEHLDTAAGIIKRVMEQCGQKYGMSVSLPVTITVGKNWADMEPYTGLHSPL